jgi:hypothetical protein
MEVSGQFHASIAFSPKKEAPIPTKQEARLAPEPV